MNLTLPKSFLKNIEDGQHWARVVTIKWQIAYMVSVVLCSLGIFYMDSQLKSSSVTTASILVAIFVGLFVVFWREGAILKYNVDTDGEIVAPYRSLSKMVEKVNELESYTVEISCESSDLNNGPLYNIYTYRLIGKNKYGGDVDGTFRVSDAHHILPSQDMLNGDLRFLDKIKFGKKQFVRK